MKKQPKILMIAPLPPPVHGSAMMTQYIKDSEIINQSVKLDWVNLSTSRRMDEIGKSSPVKIWRFVNSYFKTLWKLCLHRYDACYLAITCRGPGFLKDAPFALLCKLFGQKIILHQHNRGMAADVDRKVYKWLLPLVYKNARVVLLSWRLYPDIEKVVGKEQVVICPNGIPYVPTYPKNHSSAPRILYLSNLMEDKGVFVLLDACRILKDKGMEFSCDFIGGETKEIDLSRFRQELKNRRLEGCVSYLGKKYGEEKHRAIASSDIFVLPTDYDCFPVVLLEAMQQSLPVVSTTVAGIPDIITDGSSGFLVEPKSPEKLAEKLEILINNSDLRSSMGREAKATFDKFFLLEAFERNILNILTDSLER